MAVLVNYKNNRVVGFVNPWKKVKVNKLESTGGNLCEATEKQPRSIWSKINVSCLFSAKEKRRDERR